MNSLKKIIFFCSILLISCAKTDPVTGEKVLIEPSPDKRAREFADKGGGYFWRNWQIQIWN